MFFTSSRPGKALKWNGPEELCNGLMDATSKADVDSAVVCEDCIGWPQSSPANNVVSIPNTLCIPGIS